MAHESKGTPLSVEELGQMAQDAHAEKHGTLKANENLKGLPQESRRMRMEREAQEAAEAEAKAQAKAEDKAAKGPKD